VSSNGGVVVVAPGTVVVLDGSVDEGEVEVVEGTDVVEEVVVVVPGIVVCWPGVHGSNSGGHWSIVVVVAGNVVGITTGLHIPSTGTGNISP